MELIKNKIVFIVSFEVECGLIMVSDIVIDDIIFLVCILYYCVNGNCKMVDGNLICE